MDVELSDLSESLLNEEINDAINAANESTLHPNPT